MPRKTLTYAKVEHRSRRLSLAFFPPPLTPPSIAISVKKVSNSSPPSPPPFPPPSPRLASLPWSDHSSSVCSFSLDFATLFFSNARHRALTGAGHCLVRAELPGVSPLRQPALPFQPYSRPAIAAAEQIDRIRKAHVFLVCMPAYIPLINNIYYDKSFFSIVQLASTIDGLVRREKASSRIGIYLSQASGNNNNNNKEKKCCSEC